MEYDASDILNRLKSEGLSDFERASLREQLKLFMREHPARVPLSVRIAAALRAPSIAFQPGYAYRAIALASAAVVFVGIGTSYAAENALPGEALYAIKINVNEPLHSAFAMSTAAQASWDTQLANRRLEEAEALAAQGKLTPVTASDLQAELSTVTQRFDKNVAALSEATSSASAVAITNDMQATLAAHANVMSQIAQAIPQAAGTLAPLVADVRGQAEALQAHTSPVVGAVATASEVHVDAATSEQASTTPARMRRTLSAQPYPAVAPSGTGTTDTSVHAAVQVTFGANAASGEGHAGAGGTARVMTAKMVTVPSSTTPAPTITVTPAVSAKAAEIEAQAREWIKSAVGVDISVPHTELDGAYQAAQTADDSSESGTGF